MSVYKIPNSKYWQYGLVITHEGQKYYFRGTTKRTDKQEAKEVEREKFKEALDSLQLGKKPEITLGDAADLWLKEHGKKLGDVRNNNIRVRKLFGLVKDKTTGEIRKERWGFSRDRKLHQLSNKDLQVMKSARRSEGLSEATINREVSLVQGIIKIAARNDYRVPHGLVFERTAESPKQRWLDDHEVEAVLRELDPRRPVKGRSSYEENPNSIHRRKMQDQYDFVLLLLDTGMRYSEAANLPKSSVKLSTGKINVFRSKTNKVTQLPITARCKEMLERRMKTPGPYVFSSLDDPQQPRVYTTKGIQAAIDRAGLNDPIIVAQFGRCTPHSMRHSLATKLVEAGMNIKKVQEYMGHSSIKTTMGYTHVKRDSEHEEFLKIMETRHR